jgi:hypothetical protein
MHSDFVVSLRKIRWRKADFADANDVLFQHYCEMQRMLRRNALTEPKLLKQLHITPWMKLMWKKKESGKKQSVHKAV